MTEVARLVGMELREYEKDGKKREICNLHLVYIEGVFRNVNGSRVEETRRPREVEPRRLKLGQLYELIYEKYTFQGQRQERLVGLEPVEES